jgi:hypothetical protein
MRTKQYKVYLTDEQRTELHNIVTKGKHSAQEIRRANIFLLLDENNPPVKKRSEIAELCHTTETTVRSAAKQFCDIGFKALYRKRRINPPIKPIVTGEVEARIIAINCSEPPAGHSRWTLSLTAERLIELQIVPAISRDTVGRALKKRTEAAQE